MKAYIYANYLSFRYITSHTPHSSDFLWTSDQPVADYLTTQKTHETPIQPPVGFEPTIPASERPHTNALDRAATVIDLRNSLLTPWS